MEIYIVSVIETDVDLPVKAFVNKDEAQKFVNEHNDEMRKLQIAYNKIDPQTISDTLTVLFMAYLSDTQNDFYQAYLTAKEAKKDDAIDWDAYYDFEDCFYSNRDLILEYAKRENFSEEEKENLNTYMEYMMLIQGSDALPYYFMNFSPIELVQ